MSSPHEFRIKRVTSNSFGKPMLEIEPAPINRDGIPEFTEALAQIVEPHMLGRDNISLRYLDQGLPTTSTAVRATVDVEEDQFAISYFIRIMIFETTNKKIGSNIQVRPAQTHVKINGIRIGVYQEIRDARTYDFREVYGDAEQSRDDLERLVLMAHNHHTKQT